MRPDNSPLQTLLAALPDARLAALVIELARASNPPASAGAPLGALTKRGPGWLKGRPRGPRKMIPAATEPAAKTTTKIDSPADAMADARRARKNQARSARRAAARQAKAGGFEKPSAVETKATNGTAATSTPTPQQPKRPQGWPKGRKRGQRLGATGQSVQAPAGNKAPMALMPGAPAAATTPSTASTPAARLWARAATLAPAAPWRVVAREFGTNEAQAQDAHRTGTLPPGIAPAALERFLEARPAA